MSKIFWNVIRIKLVLFSFIIFNSFLFSQNCKLFVIKDGDTTNINGDSIAVYLEVNNHLISFNQGNQLIYPDTTLCDSVNSIVVKYNNDILSFFNLQIKLKQSSLPEAISRLLQPEFKYLVLTKQNMYLYIDSFPFDSSDNHILAESEAERHQIDIYKIIVLTLYYQVSESTAILRNSE